MKDVLKSAKKLSLIFCSVLLAAALLAGCAAVPLTSRAPLDNVAADAADYSDETDEIFPELEQLLEIAAAQDDADAPAGDISLEAGEEALSITAPEETDAYPNAPLINTQATPAPAADNYFDPGIYQDISVLENGGELFGAGQEPESDDVLAMLNKVSPPSNGIPVVISVDQAKTYPSDTKNNIPDAAFYPLPKGTIDYVVGKTIEYKTKDSKGKNVTYKYRQLASGVRVESSDIKSAKSGPKNNSITSASISTKNDGHTYLVLKTKQKVPYSLSYKNDSVQISFHYTVNVPQKTSLKSNPMFTKATWSDNCKINLTFAKKGGFMGYKAYYDTNGNLIFRFNNPPDSIKNARIAIDAGHGGKDIGTQGSNSKWNEKDINLAIAKKLAEELKKRGATVKLLDSANYLAQSRVPMAEEFKADLFISVHSNSAKNTAAAGTEVYYFYPFSKQLASNCAANVSKQLSTTNRGAKWSYYHISLSPQFASVLVETGFMTNKAEYKKLISSQYHQRIATGIANSIEGAIKTAKTGVASTSVTSKATTPVDPEDEDSVDDTSESGVKVKSVKLSRTSASMIVGKKASLTVTISPDNASNKNVTWASSSSSVASVSESGVITAKKAGTAKITATTKDGGFKATCQITVKKKTSNGGGQIEDLYFISEDETLAVGSSLELGVDIYPEDADDPTLTWTSSSKSVAIVDSFGTVTGLKAGSATITATTTDGSRLKSTCKITVTNDKNSGTSSSSDSADTGITLKKAGSAEIYDDYLEIYPGEKRRIEVLSDNDEIVRNSDFTWRIDSPGVATVNAYGVVTAKTVGSATITAKATGYTLYCNIEVTRTRTKITEIKLNKTDTAIVKGKTEQLKATFKPSYASSSDITWSSSNSRIASVDANGRVTAVNAGKVTITAKAKSSSVSAKCTVEVVKKGIPIDYIDLMGYDTLELSVGDEDQIPIELWPENATDSSVVWTSSNSRVCTVDSKGNVVAKAKGTATIKAASATDSSVYAQCKITVY